MKQNRNVRQTPSGSWQVQIRRKNLEKPIVRTFDTEKEANSFFEEITYKLDILKQHPTSITFKSILLKYKEEVLPTLKSEKVQTYRVDFLIREFPDLVSMEIGRITKSDLVKVKDFLDKRNSKPNTIKQYFSLILQVFKKANSWDIPINLEVVKSIELQKIGDNSRKKLLTDDELLKLKETISRRSPWLLPIVDFALLTAARLGEIVNLQWKNIYQDLDGTMMCAFIDTKNNDDREIVLEDDALAIIEGLREKLLTLYPKYKTENYGEINVFNGTQSSISNAFKECMIEAKLRDVKIIGRNSQHFVFHSLRHQSISTHLSLKLSNILILSAMTGHKTLTVLKKYFKPRARDIKKLLESK